MFSFQFDIEPLGWVLIGVQWLLLLSVMLVYWWPLRRILRHRDKPVDELSASCPVSVIVYAADEAESLRHLLPALLGQNYHGPMEVIVVNEGQSDNTVEVVERLRLIHNNLYLTYTPDGARQLSRKKLALMIGIKAARYPVVVQTVASARIESDHWLASMTEPFLDPKTEVVLGSSYLEWDNDRGMGRRSRVFNGAADTAAWLAAACARHPYRGTELNVAYTKEAFFRNRGFSKSLNLKYGDDDIFISEIARGDNTAVVLNADAMVERSARNVKRVYRELRGRYFFTGRRISHTARRMQALGAWLHWVIIGLWAAVTWLLFPNLAGAPLGIVPVLALLVASTVLWRKVICKITGKRLLFTLPWLMLMRPFANAFANVKSLLHRKNNYTWN